MQVVEEDNATVAMSMERITNAFLTFRGNNLLVTSRFYMPDYFDALERKLVKKFTPLPENRPQIKQFELVAALFVAYTCDKLGAAFFPEEHQQEDHVPFLYDAYEQAIASFFHDENASAAVNEMFPVPLPINSVLGGMVHFVDTRFSLNNGSNAKNWWLDLRTRLETLIPEWTERNPGGNLQSLPLKYLKMLVVRRKRNNLVQLRRFFPAIVHVIADVHMEEDEEQPLPLPRLQARLQLQAPPPAQQNRHGDQQDNPALPVVDPEQEQQHQQDYFVTWRMLEDCLMLFFQQINNHIHNVLHDFQPHFIAHLNTHLFPAWMKEVFNNLFGGDRARIVAISSSSLPFKQLLTHGRITALCNDSARFMLQDIHLIDRISQYCVISHPDWADRIEGKRLPRDDEVLVAMIGEVPVLLDHQADYNWLLNNLNQLEAVWIYIDMHYHVRCAYEPQLMALSRTNEVKEIIGKVVGNQEFAEDGNFYFQQVRGGVKVSFNDGGLQQLKHRINMQMHQEHRRDIDNLQQRTNWMEIIIMLSAVIVFIMLIYQISLQGRLSEIALTNQQSTNSITELIHIKHEEEMLRNLLLLRQEIEEGRPLHAFEYSISMARTHEASKKEYICRYDNPSPVDGRYYYWQSSYKVANQTLLDYLVDQPDDVTCTKVPHVICSKSIELGFDWSYRMALFMVQRNAWKYLGDAFSPYLLGQESEWTNNKGPTCYNPLVHYNTSLIPIVERHMKINKLAVGLSNETTLTVSPNDPNMQEMIKAMSANLKIHIEAGFYEKGVGGPKEL